MPDIKDKSCSSSSLFAGGGQMGELMRAYDWSAHPLGTPDTWPQSLRTTIKLILNSAHPMFIWWSKELYMFHNDQYLPALGKKHPNALGASAREMWAEVWQQIGGIVENILEGGEPFYAEDLLMILERKGFLEETYWTFSYSAAPDDNGEVGGIFCACNEVTHNLLGQRRLNTIKSVADATTTIATVEQVGEKVSKVLQENLPCIPFSLIYLVNGAGTEANLYGQTGDISEIFTPPVVRLNEPEAEQRWPFSLVQQTQKIAIIERPKDSKDKWPGGVWPEPSLKAVTLPIMKPGQNELIGFFVAGVSPKLEYDLAYENFHRLLTGQIATSLSSVQSRVEAERQQENLVDLFQQAPVAIAIFRGEDFVIEFANPGMCELWGRSPEKLIGKPVFKALPEASGQGLEALLSGVLKTGNPYVANEQLVKLYRNGRLEDVFIHFVYHPLRDAKGLITGITAVAVEVSEQVRARHEIEEKNAELVAINADLDNFVYSASHDLKAPISNIEGLMQALVRHLPAETLSSERERKLVSLIQASIERFKKTVVDLTEITKLQKIAGEDIAFFDLSEVIKEVQLDLEQMIEQSGASINTTVVDSPLLRFSAKNLRSIVYNLLSNAVKYRSPERKLVINIHIEADDDYILLSVADNGLGMDLKNEAKIFSMFKRLHDHVEGSGIGLYIVKKIVENTGGKIEVASRVGVGSTFKVYFKR